MASRPPAGAITPIVNPGLLSTREEPSISHGDTVHRSARRGRHPDL
jgi:hypothetical protein